MRSICRNDIFQLLPRTHSGERPHYIYQYNICIGESWVNMISHCCFFYAWALFSQKSPDLWWFQIISPCSNIAHIAHFLKAIILSNEQIQWDKTTIHLFVCLFFFTMAIFVTSPSKSVWMGVSWRIHLIPSLCVPSSTFTEGYSKVIPKRIAVEISYLLGYDFWWSINGCGVGACHLVDSSRHTHPDAFARWGHIWSTIYNTCPLAK